MSQSIRISDDLSALAEQASQAQQMEVCALLRDGLPSLQERQLKDEEEVSAGLRTARSLWAVQKGDLEGYRFTHSKTSEFEKVGQGW